MIPYADFTYFGLLLYTVIPTLVLGLLGRWSWRWVLLATLVMVAVQYGSSAPNSKSVIWLVAIYALLQWAVAAAFLRVRTHIKSRTVFYSAVGLALLPLLAAKFVPLLTSEAPIGFLGISYVTFRSLDVIFGIQDRAIVALPTGEYLAYLFFFPTISAGPIDRYRRFAADWNRWRNRQDVLQDLDSGVHRIFTGFLYKFIIAVLVQRYWMEPVAREHGFLATVAYMYAYGCYLFFDFAGYSAFAIGLSYLFGIHTPENFRRPFLAHSISEFWTRWHISLSSWFRDHVYTRFVLMATKRRWFKSRYLASYLGFCLSFGLMGLWHGTELRYLVYGFYHAALLTGYDLFSRWNKTRKLWGEGPVWRVAGIVLTAHAVLFGFLIFSGRLG